MKTQCNLTVATAVALLSFGIGAFLTVPASQGATPGFTAARKPAATEPVNVRIQQELQRELLQRMHTHESSIARIHHEFALKDAEIRRMHTVIARKDAVIRHLRTMLGQPAGG